MGDIFGCGNFNERGHVGDFDVDERIASRYVMWVRSRL
jgi:hypothetical protein